MRASRPKRPLGRTLSVGLLVGLPVVGWATLGPAQEPSPWARGTAEPRYEQPGTPPRPNDAYRPPRPDYQSGGYPPPPAYGQPPPGAYGGPPPGPGYGQSYAGTPPQGYG